MGRKSRPGTVEAVELAGRLDQEFHNRGLVRPRLFPPGRLADPLEDLEDLLLREPLVPQELEHVVDLVQHLRVIVDLAPDE